MPQLLYPSLKTLILCFQWVRSNMGWGATRAGCLSKHSKKEIRTTAVYRQDLFPSTVSLCFPGTTFHCRLITQAWLTRCWCASSWPDCTLSPSDRLLLMNRQVTQSIATQWRCCCHWTDGLIPKGFCFPHLKLWPFSPVLPVQVKHSRNHAYLRCGLSATYHCMPLTSFLSQSTNKDFIKCLIFYHNSSQKPFLEKNHSPFSKCFDLLSFDAVRHTAD